MEEFLYAVIVVRSPRALLLAVGLIVALVTVSAPAVAADGSAAAVKRPSVEIVKQGLVKHWGLDQETSVDKIQLVFKSVRLQPTRKSVSSRDFIAFGLWVTPVASVFDQVVRQPANDYCWIYRWNFTGIFWKGDFGWTFKNRDVTYKRIADSC